MRTSVTKNILKTAVLKCTFWGSNFELHLCSEMYFLREQFWSAPLFWNTFFREQFLSTTMFWNAFFEEAVLKCIYVLKCIFRGSNYFLIYGCWLVWQLLYVFYQSFNHKQDFSSFDMYKYKSMVITNWLQSVLLCEQRHMHRMIAIPREILHFPK